MTSPGRASSETSHDERVDRGEAMQGGETALSQCDTTPPHCEPSPCQTIASQREVYQRVPGDRALSLPISPLPGLPNLGLSCFFNAALVLIAGSRFPDALSISMMSHQDECRQLPRLQRTRLARFMKTINFMRGLATENQLEVGVVVLSVIWKLVAETLIRSYQAASPSQSNALKDLFRFLDLSSQMEDDDDGLELQHKSHVQVVCEQDVADVVVGLVNDLVNPYAETDHTILPRITGRERVITVPVQPPPGLERVVSSRISTMGPVLQLQLPQLPGGGSSESAGPPSVQDCLDYYFRQETLDGVHIADARDLDFDRSRFEPRGPHSYLARRGGTNNSNADGTAATTGATGAGEFVRVTVRRQTEVFDPPPVLMLNLPRKVHDAWGRSAIVKTIEVNDIVHLPVRAHDHPHRIAPLLQAYRIRGMIVHQGTAGGRAWSEGTGHYVTYMLGTGDGWTLHNDRRVTRVEGTDVPKMFDEAEEGARMVLYEAVDSVEQMRRFGSTRRRLLDGLARPLGLESNVQHVWHVFAQGNQHELLASVLRAVQEHPSSFLDLFDQATRPNTFDKAEWTRMLKYFDDDPQLTLQFCMRLHMKRRPSQDPVLNRLRHYYGGAGNVAQDKLDCLYRALGKQSNQVMHFLSHVVPRPAWFYQPGPDAEREGLGSSGSGRGASGSAPPVSTEAAATANAEAAATAEAAANAPTLPVTAPNHQSAEPVVDMDTLGSDDLTEDPIVVSMDESLPTVTPAEHVIERQGSSTWWQWLRQMYWQS